MVTTLTRPGTCDDGAFAFDVKLRGHVDLETEDSVFIFIENR